MMFPRPDEGEISGYIVVAAPRENDEKELMKLLKKVGEFLEAGAGVV